jgi:radical SAM protein with 4Fe4S-binding SPASM domain
VIEGSINVIRYLKAGTNVITKPNVVRDRPIHIQVEPTDACNLDCSFCAHSKVIHKARLMSLEEFKKIIDTIQPKKVTLSGYGEPLLNPALFDMIAYAKAHHASVNTTSNLTRLDDSKAEKLIESGLALMNVSIDAASPETYRLGRGEDFFRQILEGVQLLLRTRARAKARRPFVRISFVIYKGNLHEVSDFIQLAHDLGVDVAFYQILELTALYERKERLIAGIPYDEFEAAVRAGSVRARELRVTTNLAQLLANLPEYWEKYHASELHGRTCMLPWFSSYITANGSLRPCCKFAPVPINMGGSIFEKDFDEIWNSEQYVKFREGHKSGGRPNRVCRECVPENALDIARRVPFSPGFFVES